MPPHDDEKIIVAQYMENLSEVKINRTYILLTRSEGMVYKRLNKIPDDGILVEPDNEIYASYKIPASDILEMWEYKLTIGRNDTKPTKSENEIINMFRI